MCRPLFARWRALPIWIAILTLALALPALAQTDVTTGRISGTVKDVDGGPLPGATVEAKNVETGYVATATSRSDGFYQIVNLPIGRYAVTASMSGFRTATRPEVRLDLGSVPTVEFRLQLTSVTESVTVTSTARAVEVTNTAIGETIQTEQLKNLPSSGRDFKNLVLLTPETRIESERGTLSIAGERGINTNVTVDGVDFNNPFFGGTVGGAEGRAPLSLSQESIKEFTVITNGASVEFGRSGGGFVNVITKSGTNQLHGSGFFYWQPQDLTAKFANGQAPNDQDKKQYGASLGGPILPDRLFFFGSYDRQDQSLTVPISTDLLTQSQPIFAKYPVLASPDNYAQTKNGWVAFGRMDFQAASAHRFMGRINYTKYNGDNGTNTSPNDTLPHNGVEGMTSTQFVGTYSGQFGASLLNDVNFNYNNEDTPRADKGLNLPEIQVGTFRYGEVSFLPITSTVKRYEIADTVTYLLQSHVFKLGGDYNDTSVSQTFKGNWRGVFVFNNVADLLAGKYFQYRQFAGLGGLTADQAGTVDFGQKEYAGFIQDQWFISPKLTVTAGVRFEYLDNPNAPVLNYTRGTTGAYPLTAQIPDVKNQWSPRLSMSYSPDPKTAVRLAAGRYWSRTPALLWSQLFSSNAIKGVQYSTITNSAGPGGSPADPTDKNCKNANGTSCFDPFAPGWGANWTPVGVERVNFSAIPVNCRPVLSCPIFTVDPNFTNPHTDRITLGFEREVVSEITAMMNFTYAKGYDLERLTDANRAYDGTTSVNRTPHYSGTRPNTFYSTNTQYVSDAHAKYYAVDFVAQKRFANNFSAGVSATWSKDSDEDSNERNFSGIQAEDFNNLATSYGPSNRDQRWRASANAVWLTPWYGIGFAGSARFATGSAYSARSNFDFNGDGQSGTDRATLGCTSIGGSATNYDCTNGVHFARNSFRQPSFYSVDVRLQKAFHIGPGDFGLAVDCFNCTNTGNKFVTQTTFGRVPGPTVGNTSVPNTSTPNAGFGNANNPGTPRTLQVSARYDF
ncbi:MAG TPA: TonB-dependent receptor [Thermoanaerobaculia bacterium]|jgi:outer membrane receptor protein involved in Fe transport